MILDETIPQPVTISKNLYPHQLHGIQMMETLEFKKNIITSSYHLQTKMGVFSDKVGYGKTLSMIGLIVRDKMEWDMKTEYIQEMVSGVFGNGVIMKKNLMRYQRINATLVVMSPSIMGQWREEVLTTNLRFLIVNKKKVLEDMKVEEYDIILCTPTFFNSLVEKYSRFAWKRFVYDEPTQTKIPSMKALVSGFMWFITSSPFDLLNKYHHNGNHFVAQIFYFMDINHLRNIIIKNDDAFVQQSYLMPEISYKYYDCYQPLLHLVRDLLTPHVIEMIAAGNIEKAVRMLGGNSTTNLYQFLIQERMDEISEAQLKIEKYTRLYDHIKREKWVQKLERIKAQTLELQQRFQDYLKNPCHICLGTPQKPLLTTCCQNIYCSQCVLQWLQTKKTCPLCRIQITSEMLVLIYPPSSLDAPTGEEDQMLIPIPNSPRLKPKNKTETILKILDTNPLGKFIIFSNYDETFQPIRNIFQEENIPFVEIRGNMAQREKQLDSFKSSQAIKVLFINSLQNGAGLNLQEATDIILYHKIVEDLQTQVVGRAFRIGRKKPLTVHFLV